MTTAAEVGRKLGDLTEPSRCQETEVKAEAAVTGAMMSIPYRCCDCGIRITTGRNSATDGDECREPIPSQMCLAGPENAPLNGTRKRQYRLNSQVSVGGTDIQRPRIYLEVPVLRMPDVFLELAEEARNSELVDDQSTDMKDVQPQRTGQARPVLVTEIRNSTPVLGSRAFRVTNTSAEMIPDINLDEPVNRSGPVGQLSDTEQPITLSVRTDKGANGPNGPVGHDMMLAGRMEMVDRPDPVVPHSRTEQSVFLRLDADQGEHIPTNRVHPGVKMFRTQPVADGSRLTIMAFNEGEDEPLEQCNEGETSDYSDAESTDSMYRSEFDHREEDYYDWHYDTAPIVPGITADEVIRTDRNAENNDGQCPTFRKGNEDNPICIPNRAAGRK